MGCSCSTNHQVDLASLRKRRARARITKINKKFNLNYNNSRNRNQGSQQHQFKIRTHPCDTWQTQHHQTGQSTHQQERSSHSVVKGYRIRSGASSIRHGSSSSKSGQNGQKEAVEGSRSKRRRKKRQQVVRRMRYNYTKQECPNELLSTGVKDILSRGASPGPNRLLSSSLRSEQSVLQSVLGSAHKKVVYEAKSGGSHRGGGRYRRRNFVKRDTRQEAMEGGSLNSASPEIGCGGRKGGGSEDSSPCCNKNNKLLKKSSSLPSSGEIRSDDGGVIQEV